MKLHKKSTKPKTGTDKFRAKLDRSQQGHVYGVGIEIYTDGGCRPTNPGPGNCGFIVIEHDQLIHQWVNGKAQTTNSEMEVKALLAALLFIESEIGTSEIVVIHTDSGYCHGTYTEYMHNWQRKGWKVNKSYMEEWQQMYELSQRLPNVKVQWVKGHAENKWNTHIDQLLSSTPIEKVSTPVKPRRAYMKEPRKATIEVPEDMPEKIVNKVMKERKKLDTANELLLAVYREMFKEYPEGIDIRSHGLKTNITEYLQKQGLI
jgi:ribonuclease HI